MPADTCLHCCILFSCLPPLLVLVCLSVTACPPPLCLPLIRFSHPHSFFLLPPRYV